MKKICVGLLSAVCLICLGLAVACSKEPEYFTLVYAEQAGITYNFGEIKSGAEVRKGYEVKFTVEFDEALEGDAPAVMANDTELKANDEGVYSFVMNADTNISVTGVFLPDNYNVVFDAGNSATGAEHEEFRIWYYDLDGKDITGVEGLTYSGGDKVSFTLKVSVYYGDSEYKVTANSVILTPDEKGVYSFDVLGDTRVTVEGLKLDTGFTVREDGGSGTPEDPFIIEKPIDLYYMADLIGDSFYSDGTFALASYRMEADIDMQGEQLFIIGDRPTDESNSIFSGNFDGNGHKISNYVINDSIIEQEGFTEVPLRYIGLFGYAVANSRSAVNISNLTLENFTIEINGAKYLTSGFYAGGLVGYGMGVNITNCSVNGKIYADGNTDYFSQVGGVAGYFTSVSASNAFYRSGIVSTSSEVEIECAIGNIYTAGGIAGMISSSAETINAYILNSYSAGSVSGAIYTGGVVGYMGPYTSVINSYASGADIYSRSEVGVISGSQIYAYSYAGGIAGYASYDTVIANSFSAAGELGAYSSLGANYQQKGEIVGGFEASAESYAQTKAIVSVNNYSKENNVTFNEAFFKTTLGWNENNWDFSGTYPAVKSGSASVNYKVTIKNGDAPVKEFTVNSYNVISHWYENGLPEYLTDGNGGRSYGYFFDKEMTRSVPSGYIPASDTVLYAGFADYSKVSGKYYLRTGNGEEAYFELGADGSYLYRYGALNFETLFVYDGNTITLLRSPAFIESVTDEGVTNTFYLCAVAKTEENSATLSFYDGINFTDEQPLVAVKEIEGFTYGGYYASGDSADYTFYKDGTGVTGNTSFTYTLVNGDLKITIQGRTETVTLSDDTFTLGGVTYKAYDEFKGTWEKSAKMREQYTFDGKGNWTYSYLAYGKDGTSISPVKPSDSGTYERRDNSIILSNGTIVGYDAVNKWLTIADTPYYRENSLVGEWRFFNFFEAVSITFEGIGADGYGVAVATYGANLNKFELTYEVENIRAGAKVTLMNGAALFGELTYSVYEQTLAGTVYLATSGGVTDNALFCLYDDFKGIWISEIGTVEFNGLGKYDIKGTANYTKTEGTVKVNGKSAGKYTVDDSGIYGEFNYNYIKYSIYYNDATGEIDVTTSEENDFKLVKADELYGVTFVSADGIKYNFNGGGNLATGGTLTISGEEKIYSYFKDGEDLTVKDGELVCGSLVLGSEYILTLNGESKKLVIENEFTGSWQKGGVDAGEVVIGDINGDRTASGSYLGTQVTFTYNAEGGYLSFTYKNETLYILAMHATRTELAISREPKTIEYEVCIKAADLDGLAGKYESSDNSFVTLDGFSTSIYSSGTAVLTDKDGKETVYSYVVNKLGEIALTGEKIFVFVEVEAGTEGAFTGNGHSYVLTEADYFYSRTGTEANGITYKFDGHGTAYTNNGKTLSYVIVSYDELRYEYTLTLSDGTNTYEAVYTRIVGDYNMDVSPDWLKGVTATDADGKTYTFDGEGKATDWVNATYEYTVERYNPADGTYRITLVSAAGEEKTEYDAVYNPANGKITVTKKAN